MKILVIIVVICTALGLWVQCGKLRDKRQYKDESWRDFFDDP